MGAAVCGGRGWASWAEVGHVYQKNKHQVQSVAPQMLCKQTTIIIKQLPEQPCRPTPSVQASLKMYLKFPSICLLNSSGFTNTG